MARTVFAIVGLGLGLGFGLGCHDQSDVAARDLAIIGGDAISAAGFTDTCVMEVSLPPDEDDNPQDPIFCTCTLVEKGGGGATVMTSARCVNENVEADTLADIDVRFGATFSGAPAGDQFGVTAVELYRYFDEDAQGVNELALLRLDGEPQAAFPVTQLRDEPLTAGDVGANVVLVGYGVTIDDGTDAGQRRAVEVPLRIVENDLVFAGTTDATTCVGDSGGPVYLNVGTEAAPDLVQIALTARHVNACSEQIQRLRIDRYTRDFIFPFADRFSGACPIDGACTTSGCRSPDPDCDPCAWGNECTEDCPTRDWDCPPGKFAGEACAGSGECEEQGRCVGAHDDADYTYCTRACDAADDECPGGMVCSDIGGGDRQCVFDPASPTPGLQGAACTDGGQCRSGICEEQICVDECDSSDPSACDSEFGEFNCLPSTQQPGTDVCLGQVRSGGGGFCSPDRPCCAIVQPDAPAGARLAMLALAALVTVGVGRLTRRRRKR